jgi:hypothetical protein
MLSSKKIVLASSALVAFGVACGSDPAGSSETIGNTQAAVTFAPTFNPNVEDGGGYFYSYDLHGAAGIPLTDGATTMCFLSGIHGVFKSAGDRVAIRHSQGSWSFEGTKGTGNPGGYAHCLLNQPPWSAEHPFAYYSWQQGQAPVNMGTTTNRTCFLMAVQGNFTSMDDRVETRRADGTWYLDGTTASSSNGIAASAMCVPRAPVSNDSWTWSTSYQGLTALPWFNGIPWPNSSTNSGSACFLTHVRGRYNAQGGAEPPVMRVWMQDEGSSAFMWYLSGSKDDPGARSAKARCVF